jgi:hypothetical protein
MEQLTLRKGESYTLALPGLGSAGYRWIVQSADAEFVSLKELLHTAEDLRGMQQGSLNQRFQLIALTPGTTRVSFAQVRSFAPNRPHATFEIELTVTGSDYSGSTVEVP